MSKPFTAKNMMKDGRFTDLFKTCTPEKLLDIETRVEQFIQEEREYCIPINRPHLCNLFCALAIYQSDLAEGMDPEASQKRIVETMKTFLIPRKKMFQRVFSIPGIFPVMRKAVPRLMMKGNGYGWDSVELDLGKNVCAFDTRKCIFATIFRKRGVPELGPCFCCIDDYLYSELPGIEFKRTGTCCRGDECCDFRFVKKEQKMQGVADTLYIPLTARIYVSKRFPDFFYDPKSLELETALPDDSIARNANEYGHMASVCRYWNLDGMVRRFMEFHPKCNVVNLGAGLETAYWRLKPSAGATFYEMDLPEVIETRRRVLGESGNDILLAGDLFDLGWADGIADTSLPTLMTVSGVFQYFCEEQILGFIAAARGRFPQAELVFDATGSQGIAYANRFVRKTGNTSAQMHFCIDDSRAFAQKAGVAILEERDFFKEPLRILGRRTKLFTRVAMRIARHGKFRSALYHLALNSPNYQS